MVSPLNNGMFGSNLLLSNQSMAMISTFLHAAANSNNVMSMNYIGGSNKGMSTNYARFQAVQSTSQQTQDFVAATKADASAFEKVVHSMFQNKDEIEYFLSAEGADSGSMLAQPRPSFAEFLLPMVAAATNESSRRSTPVPPSSSEETASYSAGDFEPLPLMMEDCKATMDENNQ